MVGVGVFTPPCNSSTLLTPSRNVSIFLRSFSSPFSYKPNGGFFLSNYKCLKGRIGFRAFAVKKRRKDKGGVLERESFDRGSYELEEDGDDDDVDDDDDEDGLLMPMENMKQWLENRPAGFGQGKAYDTSVEDKLLDEMQQSRVAQLANINKLKHNPIASGGNGAGKSQSAVMGPEVVIPAGVRVRLLNLPKKKNIHRDLQLAFKGVPGIISLSPAVTGTKKTRDPICKGYGFVYFKSEEHANRFVKNFGTASVAFGKIQKQIKCELASPSSKDDALDFPMPNTLAKSSLPVLRYHEDEGIITKISSLSSNSTKESESDESYDHEDEGIISKISSLSSNSPNESESDDSDESEDSDVSYDSDAEFSENPKLASDNISPKLGSPPDDDKSFLSEQDTLPPVKKKPVAVKTKGPKPAKLGSANRLKSKDKSLLTGVFSKYGAKAKASANKDG